MRKASRGEKAAWGSRPTGATTRAIYRAKNWGLPSSITPPIRTIPCAGTCAATGCSPPTLSASKSSTNDKSQDGSISVEPGQTLRYRYRVIVHPGDVNTADIAGLWQKYSSGN